MNVEIDQLQHFLKVAERQSFTGAADEIGLSQSALSRSVAKLEAELGQPVFERQSRRVTLTEAGELLQARARQILALVADTKAEIVDDGASGRVRLAAIPTIAPYFLPELLQQLSQSLPKASVTVQEDTTDNLLKRCAQGEVDLAILALPIATKHIEIEELFEEELLLVLPASHSLTRLKKIALTDVVPFPFVLLDEVHCLTDNIVSFCRQRSFQPIAAERTSQLAMIQELVALNHGVSMIPAMARNLDQSDRRIYRSLEGQRPTRKIAMVWNPYRFQSALLLRVRKLIGEHCKKTKRGDRKSDAPKR